MEDAPTTTYKSTQALTHRSPFSIFALFTEPAITTTPTDTETPTDTTTTPTDEKPPAGEFPTTMVLAIFAVLVIVIAAGYFFMVRK